MKLNNENRQRVHLVVREGTHERVKAACDALGLYIHEGYEYRADVLEKMVKRKEKAD